MQAASIAVNLAQAIADRKIAEIRISKAYSSCFGSPGRVLYAHPLRVVVDVEATPPSPSRGELPADSLLTESAPSPAQHTPSAVPQSDNVLAPSQSDEPTTIAPPTEPTPSPVVHTPSAPIVSTESMPVLLFVRSDWFRALLSPWSSKLEFL